MARLIGMLPLSFSDGRCGDTKSPGQEGFLSGKGLIFWGRRESFWMSFRDFTPGKWHPKAFKDDLSVLFR